MGLSVYCNYHAISADAVFAASRHGFYHSRNVKKMADIAFMRFYHTGAFSVACHFSVCINPSPPRASAENMGPGGIDGIYYSFCSMADSTALR